MTTLNGLMEQLCDELVAGGVDEVLAQRLTLAALWADLARLAGEALPRWVATALDADRPRLSVTGRAAAWRVADRAEETADLATLTRLPATSDEEAGQRGVELLISALNREERRPHR